MPRFDGTSGPDVIDGTNDADVIKGYAGDDTLNGLGGDDDIDGGDDNDTIDGGTGADFMAGQAGNDTYYVDDANDRVAESLGFGNDRVYTTVDYVVPDNVELMAVTDPRSTFVVNLYGNSDANEIYGNDGANVIDGRAGADIMYGNGGDDAYYVDNTGDIVRDFIIAGNDGGNDIIFTTVSYQLGQLTGEYIERLAVLDPASTTSLLLFGNDLDNEITGNDGDNTIRGLGASTRFTASAAMTATICSGQATNPTASSNMRGADLTGSPSVSATRSPTMSKSCARKGAAVTPTRSRATALTM